MIFRHKNTHSPHNFRGKPGTILAIMPVQYSMNKQDIEKENKEVDSRKRSAIETVIDVILGFLIFVPVNYLVLPLFVEQIAEYNLVGMLTISAIFTSISLVRKYAIRRWFENHRLVLSEKKIWIINNINPKRFVRNLLEKLGGLKN